VAYGEVVAESTTQDLVNALIAEGSNIARSLLPFHEVVSTMKSMFALPSRLAAVTSISILWEAFAAWMGS